MSTKLLLRLFAAAAILGASPGRALADAGEFVLLDGKPLVAKDTKVQDLAIYPDLEQAGESRLNMTLTITNGTITAPAFNWLRISIPGMPMLTEKNFGGKSYLSVDVTGKLGRGPNQILISGAGPAGATLNWKLTTGKLAAESIEPATIEAGTGQPVTINGENFCTDPSVDVVTFNGKAGTTVSATPTQLKVVPPYDLEGGDADVVVTVVNQQVGPLALKVKNVPVLTSTSLISAPPGQPVTITGRNFSPNLSENHVFIGGVEAPVLSGDTENLNVVVPQIPSPLWHVPVYVKIGDGAKSNELFLRVQSRVY